MSLQNPLHVLTAILPNVEQENYILIPGDLVREIFSHLVLRDIVHCGLVCKAWHNHSADLSYLNTLDLSHLKVKTEDLFFNFIQKRFPSVPNSIRVLKLGRNASEYFEAAHVAVLCTFFPYITHFHDHHSNIEKLPEIVFSLPKLEVLCVCAEYDYCYKFFQGPFECQSLRVINMESLSNTSIARVIKSVPNFKKHFRNSIKFYYQYWICGTRKFLNLCDVNESRMQADTIAMIKSLPEKEIWGNEEIMKILDELKKKGADVEEFEWPSAAIREFRHKSDSIGRKCITKIPKYAKRHFIPKYAKSKFSDLTYPIIEDLKEIYPDGDAFTLQLQHYFDEFMSVANFVPVEVEVWQGKAFMRRKQYQQAYELYLRIFLQGDDEEFQAKAIWAAYHIADNYLHDKEKIAHLDQLIHKDEYQWLKNQRCFRNGKRGLFERDECVKYEHNVALPEYQCFTCNIRKICFGCFKSCHKDCDAAFMRITYFTCQCEHYYIKDGVDRMELIGSDTRKLILTQLCTRDIGSWNSVNKRMHEDTKNLSFMKRLDFSFSQELSEFNWILQRVDLTQIDRVIFGHNRGLNDDMLERLLYRCVNLKHIRIRHCENLTRSLQIMLLQESLESVNLSLNEENLEHQFAALTTTAVKCRKLKSLRIKLKHSAIFVLPDCIMQAIFSNNPQLNAENFVVDTNSKENSTIISNNQKLLAKLKKRPFRKEFLLEKICANTHQQLIDEILNGFYAVELEKDSGADLPDWTLIDLLYSQVQTILGKVPNNLQIWAADCSVRSKYYEDAFDEYKGVISNSEMCGCASFVDPQLQAIYMIHHVAKYYLENEHRLSEVWYTPVELNETNPWKIRSWNQIKNDPSLDKRLNTEEPKMQQIRADIKQLETCYNNDECTSDQLGEMLQYQYTCFTCNIDDVCFGCLDYCHQSHLTSFVQVKKFACTCRHMESN
jgi:hypothetical protein